MLTVFGPYYVKVGRSSVKRHGCIFTCLTTRAVHLEVLCSLDTNAFINALCRFISRRGKPNRIFSDNGTKFVGAYRELGEALKEAQNKKKLRHFLLNQSINWSFNPPAASHMGGAWERLIRSCRRVLNATVRNVVLTEDELLTVFCQVEAVLNSRPLTKVSDDVNDDEVLTPNHFLTPGGMGTSVSVDACSDDQYRRRWRYVQHLADRFWKRWLREYLPIIQHRQKWVDGSPDIRLGDVVLLVDELAHRNQWSRGLVTKVYKGRDDKIRSCQIKTQTSVLVRPVQKLCLLEACRS